MSSFAARASAAGLALRWHSRTGALLALTATLTLIGAIPALALLGSSRQFPGLTMALADTGALRADWGGAGVVWTQLQQLALLQLYSLVRGAVLLILAIGAATLVALHLARASTRGTDVLVARAVGASRTDILAAMFLESGALAVVALSIGTLVSIIVSLALRAAWPGASAPADLALSAATIFGITSVIMAGPLLLARALTARRLVDDDRRPLALIVPAMQLGAALVVIAGGITVQRALTLPRVNTNAEQATTLVQPLRATENDRLARAKGFAAFLAQQHAANPAQLVSLGASGIHRGMGTTADVITDCGRRCGAGTAVRGRSETVSHAVVSGDSFAINNLAVLRGRALTDADRWDAPLVTVVSERFARDLFRGTDPIGQRVRLSLLDDRWFEIVGVVSDARSSALGANLLPPYTIYLSVLQHPVAQLEVATRGTPVSADALTGVGRRSAPAQTLAELANGEVRALRWFTSVLMGMGGIAALIAIGGLLVMLQLWLDSQRLELGVMRAVGARRRDIQRLVLGRTALVAIGGSLFGAWLGLIAWDVLPRVIPGAPAWDGSAVTITAAALSVLTLCAGALVARRVVRTPVSTLLLDAV